MNAKLGLSSLREGDDRLVGDLLNQMQKNQMDYTNTFRDLHPERASTGLEIWHEDWLSRLVGEEAVLKKMTERNPVVIPRNHFVESALNTAGYGDMTSFENLLDLLSDPFNRERDFGELAESPPQDAPAYKTFCGT